jgi:hypothetical protein
MFMGVTKKVPEYDFLICGDIIAVTGDDVLPTCDEIMKARGK